MNIFVPKTICPKCQESEFWRERRLWWMRILAGSRYLRCNNCNESFLYFRPIRVMVVIVGIAIFALLMKMV